MTESSAESRYETYANLIAPAAVGAALGILFGRGMRRAPANITALSLLGAAAVVAAPVLTDLIRRTANRPSSDRGSRRRLEVIRNGGLPEEGLKDFFVDSPNALLP
jgi:F0F1-type ATP synthase assembly protein I